MKTEQNQMETVRHSISHLMSMAVQEIYPQVGLGVGPAIEDGFYQDYDLPEPITPDILPKLEKRMRELIKQNIEFKQHDVDFDEAYKFYKHDPYKTGFIDDLKAKGEKQVSFYKSDWFDNLCAGPHVESTKEIDPKAFKLTRIAGAYWRGDEKNKMLTRIYGLAFATQEELTAHLTMLAEAEKRDHRILGKQLKIFTISPLVGSGLPLLQPNGMIIRKEISDYLWDLHKEKNYLQVWSPHIAHEELYQVSGHAAKFGDELFRVQGKEEKFFLKPMNCPHHMQIFADNQFSYRDMPVRYFEPATVYRDEKSGQLSGLTRVRSITQDDGHLFCRVSQIKEEVKTITDIIKSFYTTIGLMNNYWVSLSVRGEDHDKYLGSDEIWNSAEEALEEAAKANDLPYKRVEGEATFYGPKLDFMFKDAIGREWQLATIQCDFNLPERFDLSFANEKGEKERPVVIHRAIAGSLERFMGIMIEHFAGNFPLWLAPVQVKILSVGENHIPYCQQLMKSFQEANIRVELDDKNESVGHKIRQSSKEKIPYVLVIGDKEMNSQDLAVRVRGQEELLNIAQDKFNEHLQKLISTRSLEL